MKRIVFALLASVVLPFGITAAAAKSARSEQDEAREAVERHEIRPFDEILAKLRSQVPGEVVRVKLERERGAWLYEFRLIERDGRVRNIEVDAASGAMTEDRDD